jgi:peroxiredoxin
MGYYIQPEYTLDTEAQYDQMADKINNMLEQDQIEQVKTLLQDEQIDVSLDDLKLLKQALFDTPSIDTNVCEAEFDWLAETDEDDSEPDTML